jgi:hypothetical protein
MRTVLDELVGLFVDDGFLALGLLAWCAAVALVHFLFHVPLLGPLLLLGCALILLLTVLRAAKRS